MQQRRADGAGDLRQFCGGRARVLEIARGQQDLDGRGKHSGAGCRVPACRARTPRIDAAAASIWPCARRSSDSPGCGLRPRSLRPRVRRFSLGELAPKSMDLAAAVERRARRPASRDVSNSHASCASCAASFQLPAQLHDLGAIEQALAAIAHEVGLSGAPLRERRGPLVRTPQIERLLTASSTLQ